MPQQPTLVQKLAAVDQDRIAAMIMFEKFVELSRANYNLLDALKEPQRLALQNAINESSENTQPFLDMEDALEELLARVSEFEGEIANFISMSEELLPKLSDLITEVQAAVQESEPESEPDPESEP